MAPLPIGPAPTNLTSFSEVVVTLVLRRNAHPLFESWIPRDLRNQEPRTAVDEVVGVCEGMFEIQCDGQGGHEEISPGISPVKPISALSVIRLSSASGAISRSRWPTHSALRESPRMAILVMQAHQWGRPFLRSQGKERVLGRLGCNAHNVCNWAHRRKPVSLREKVHLRDKGRRKLHIQNNDLRLQRKLSHAA